MNNTIKGKITIPTIKGTIPGTSYTQSSSDYEVLTNKPQINGVELLGNKTTSDLGIESFSGDYNDLTNKPSIPSKTSELTNDSGFITNTVNNLTNYYTKTNTDSLLSAKANTSDIPTKVSDLTNDVGYSTFSGSYTDLSDKPTIPTKTSDLTNDSGFITSSALGGYVPTSRTINSKALTNNITLSASDVGALSSSTTYVSSVNGSSGAITGLQTTSNLSTSIDETSTDTEYPSAKVVYDSQVEQNEKIEELERYKTIYNVLPKVEDEGEALTLSDTGNATLKIDLKGNTTQEGTPTPTSPIPINVVSGDNEIDICGKNLFDKDNAILINGYAGATTIGKDNNMRSIYVACKPNTTYTISKMLSARFKVSLTNTNVAPTIGTTITSSEQHNNYTSITITTGNDTTYIVVWYYYATADTSTEQEIRNSIQIEQGSTATTYEPYIGNTYPIQLGSIELCKIGKYQDRIYKDSGKWYIEKKIGKIVLDGSENWLLYLKTFLLDNLGTGKPNSICSNFSSQVSNWISSDENNRGKYTMTNTANQFKCMPLTDMTLEEFKTWLSTHNTIVYYVLATPTTTEITDTELINQLETLKTATSYDNQTNISQTNDDLPFIISASALYDLNNLVTRVAILETE